MVAPKSSGKNIWIAASDGDIERVKYLIEHEDFGPHSKDDNSYTPMHAAASYHNLELLEYLISIGGDINLKDDEGETPLFTVESLDAAIWLIEHGADPLVENNEGQTAADYIEDDHPEISNYLRSLSSPNPNQPQGQINGFPVSPNTRVDEFTSNQTSNLMEETRKIMEEAERTGEDPDAKLREVVQRAVAQGLRMGGAMGDEAEEARKRARTGDDDAQ